MKKTALMIIIALLSVACATTAPVHPAVVTPPIVTIQYAINVPLPFLAAQFSGQYPNGVALSPIEAQQQFDYTTTYGRPNVYYGATSPPPEAYTGVGIVIAPFAAASKREFTSADWPGICAATCNWLGHFASVPQ